MPLARFRVRRARGCPLRKRRHGGGGAGYFPSSPSFLKNDCRRTLHGRKPAPASHGPERRPAFRWFFIPDRAAGFSEGGAYCQNQKVYEGTYFFATGPKTV
jgi:hypothetical protein